MAILKRNNQVFPALTSWFDDFFADDMDVFNNYPTVPKVNIKERKKDFVLELAVPGMKKEDFNLDLDNNILTISAQAKDEKVEEDGNYTKKEFHYSEFKRIFTIPEAADSDKIDAEYKNGLLKIIINKKPEAQAKPAKKISIK